MSTVSTRVRASAVTASASPSGTAASEWFRVLMAAGARAGLTLVCGAAIWAVAPLVLGWQPTTVMTGSMGPRIAPGDVVVTRPVGDAPLRVGQVVLHDDPDHAGRLRLHRIVRVERDAVITRGDANRAADSSPVPRSAVHGIGVLRIPMIGRPVLWARHGDVALLGATIAAVAGLLLLADLDRSIRRRPADPPVSRPGQRFSTGVARAGAASTRAAGGGLTVAVVVVLSLLPAQHASAAPFRSPTGTSTGFSATTPAPVSDLTCTNGSGGSITVSWNSAGVTAQTFDLLSGDSVLATAPGAARAITYTRSGLLELGNRYALRVRTNLAGTWTATTAAAVPVDVTSLLGLTSVRCTT